MTVLTTLASLGTKALGATTSVASTGFSFLTGAKYWLIALAVSVALAGSAGWYAGSTHEAKIQATAAASASLTAATQARDAQAAKDSRDYAASKADFDKRHAADLTATAALNALLAKKPKVVYLTKAGVVTVVTPDQPQPAVAAESMKSLNDPALVGETQ